MNDDGKIRSLIAANARAANDSHSLGAPAINAWAETFALDGCFVVAGVELKTRARIHAFHSAVVASVTSFAKHLVGASHVERFRSTATARTDFLLVGEHPHWSVVGFGLYHDTLVRKSGAWGILRREAIMASPPQAIVDIARTIAG